MCQMQESSTAAALKLKYHKGVEIVKNKVKTMLSILVAAGMIFSVSACSQTQEAEQVQNTSKDPFGKYEKPVKISAVLGYGEPTDQNVPKSTTPENQAFNQLLKDELNIEIEYLWTVPEAQYEQKFSTAIAANDLPDLLALSQKDYEMLKENDMLADLSEAYEYASDKLKEMVERDPGVLKSVTHDGKIYAIPRYSDVRTGTPLLWLRQDWMDKLGLSAPQTWDDVIEIARAFVEKDPDGNGENDTYGFGATAKTLTPWGYGIKPMFMPYGSFIDQWIKDDSGKLVYGNIQPETKTALESLAKMYQEGLLDKEIFTKDEEKVAEDIASGKIGMAVSEWWFGEVAVNDSCTADPNAKWICMEIPPMTEGGKPKICLNRQSIVTYYAINKKCKNPEAMIKSMNVYLEAENKYKDILTPENGHVWSWAPTIYLDPYEITTTFEKVNEAYESGNSEGITDEKQLSMLSHMAEYEQYKNGEIPWDGTKLFGNLLARVDKEGGWATTIQAVENADLYYNEFYGAPTETMQDNGATLEKLTEETFIKIIAGEKDISAFDEYVTTWKNLGGDAITEEVNQWYAQNQ